ncbi:MAG: cupin domain-containing protein, partial [Gammaproteobacteria bacterium]|nr:cupin domain-containing protein [Gammaproteobacteria bacterium]
MSTGDAQGATQEESQQSSRVVTKATWGSSGRPRPGVVFRDRDEQPGMHMKPVMNLADAPQVNNSSGNHFEARMQRLAQPLGAQRIGANLTTVPPHKAAFPFHHHHANEEHFFVLSGSGVLRYGDDWHAVGPNDYVYCQPGSAEHAHQLINTGDVDLVYLAISTLQ